jgi:hypothetical protein
MIYRKAILWRDFKEEVIPNEAVEVHGGAGRFCFAGPSAARKWRRSTGIGFGSVVRREAFRRSSSLISSSADCRAEKPFLVGAVFGRGPSQIPIRSAYLVACGTVFPSNRIFAGRSPTIGLRSGPIMGQGRVPKKLGLDVR